MTAERAAAVRAAVHGLPEDMREAIVLCEWEERSVAEAATILETTPKSVEARLYRARQLLRKKLEQWLLGRQGQWLAEQDRTYANGPFASPSG